jgi:hypothetical protein
VSIKRALGTVLAAVLAFLAIADAPTQLAQWKKWWDQAVAAIDWSGNGARWAFLVLAVIVGLWAWDVHGRLLSQWSSVLPDWLSGLVRSWRRAHGKLLKEVADQLHGVEVHVDDLAERVRKLEAHTDISGTSKQLVALISERKMEEFARGKPWRIDSARYGIGEALEESQDVLGVLESYRHQDKIEIIVNNDTMRTGNIFAGDTKTLYVRVSQGGMWQKLEVKETHKLVLPPTTFRFTNTGITFDQSSDIS